MILKCTCKHDYQDKRYGAYSRVHNPTTKDLKVNGWRCCVCGAEKNLNGEEVKAAKKP